SYKVSWNWIPIVDNNRYKPLPVSVVFLQNAFDVVFLFAFIQFWNWGPLLVVLYYIIETLVMTFFATLKWSKKSSAYSDSTLIHNSLFKWIFIVVIHATVGVFSYAQIDTIHEVLGLIISIPPWEVLLKDDKQFL